MDGCLTIILIVLLILLVLMNVIQKYKRRPKMRYTCGTEGDCVTTLYGTYDSKSDCEKQCHI